MFLLFLFKHSSRTQNANTFPHLTFPSSQVCLLVRKKWEGCGGLPFSLKSMITVTPSLAFKSEGMFDFSLRVDAIEAAQLGVFPACLPPQVS